MAALLDTLARVFETRAVNAERRSIQHDNPIEAGRASAFRNAAHETRELSNQVREL